MMKKFSSLSSSNCSVGLGIDGEGCDSDAFILVVLSITVSISFTRTWSIFSELAAGYNYKIYTLLSSNCSLGCTKPIRWKLKFLMIGCIKFCGDFFSLLVYQNMEHTLSQKVVWGSGSLGYEVGKGRGEVKMRLVGLTGGIASGKSTVSRRLESQGLPIIDADKVAQV